jgi:hypothetical protein
VKAEWISVTDRLPSDDDGYVAALFDVDDGHFYRRLALHFGGHWEDEWGHVLDVTHWMPLPPDPPDPPIGAQGRIA